MTSPFISARELQEAKNRAKREQLSALQAVDQQLRVPEVPLNIGQPNDPLSRRMNLFAGSAPTSFDFIQREPDKAVRTEMRKSFFKRVGSFLNDNVLKPFAAFSETSLSAATIVASNPNVGLRQEGGNVTPTNLVPSLVSAGIGALFSAGEVVTRNPRLPTSLQELITPSAEQQARATATFRDIAALPRNRSYRQFINNLAERNEDRSVFEQVALGLLFDPLNVFGVPTLGVPTVILATRLARSGIKPTKAAMTAIRDPAGARMFLKMGVVGGGANEPFEQAAKLQLTQSIISQFDGGATVSQQLEGVTQLTGRLAQEVSTTPVGSVERFEAARDRAMFELLISTGARTGDIRNQKLGSIRRILATAEDDPIFVTAAIRQGAQAGFARATSVIPTRRAELLQALTDFVDARAALTVGRNLDDADEALAFIQFTKARGAVSVNPPDITAVLRARASQFDITALPFKTGSEPTAAAFRAVVATELLLRGAPIEVISRHLGHADVPTTRRFYIKEFGTDLGPLISKVINLDQLIPGASETLGALEEAAKLDRARRRVVEGETLRKGAEPLTEAEKLTKLQAGQAFGKVVLSEADISPTVQAFIRGTTLTEQELTIAEKVGKLSTLRQLVRDLRGAQRQFNEEAKRLPNKTTAKADTLRDRSKAKLMADSLSQFLVRELDEVELLVAGSGLSDELKDLATTISASAGDIANALRGGGQGIARAQARKLADTRTMVSERPEFNILDEATTQEAMFEKLKVWTRDITVKDFWEERGVDSLSTAGDLLKAFKKITDRISRSGTAQTASRLFGDDFPALWRSNRAAATTRLRNIAGAMAAEPQLYADYVGRTMTPAQARIAGEAVVPEVSLPSLAPAISPSRVGLGVNDEFARVLDARSLGDITDTIRSSDRLANYLITNIPDEAPGMLAGLDAAFRQSARSIIGGLVGRGVYQVKSGKSIMAMSHVREMAKTQGRTVERIANKELRGVFPKLTPRVSLIDGEQGHWNLGDSSFLRGEAPPGSKSRSVQAAQLDWTDVATDINFILEVPFEQWDTFYNFTEAQRNVLLMMHKVKERSLIALQKAGLLQEFDDAENTMYFPRISNGAGTDPFTGVSKSAISEMTTPGGELQQAQTWFFNERKVNYGQAMEQGILYDHPAKTLGRFVQTVAELVAEKENVALLQNTMTLGSASRTKAAKAVQGVINKAEKGLPPDPDDLDLARASSDFGHLIDDILKNDSGAKQNFDVINGRIRREREIATAMRFRGAAVPWLNEEDVLLPAREWTEIRNLTSQGRSSTLGVAQGLGQLSNIARFLAAGLDIGFFLIHGLPILAMTAIPQPTLVRGLGKGNVLGTKVRFDTTQSEALWKGIQQVGSSLKDPEAINRILNQPGYLEAQAKGLSFGLAVTNVGEPVEVVTQSMFSQLRRIPVVGKPVQNLGLRFESAFNGAMSTIRVIMWKAYAPLAEANNEDLGDLARLINKMTGTMNTDFAGFTPFSRSLQSIFLFSAFYKRAAYGLLLDTGKATAGKRGKGITREVALRSTASLLGAGALAGYILGEMTGNDKWYDPRPAKSDGTGGGGPGFMAGRFGDGFIGFGAAYYSLIRLGSNLYTQLAAAQSAGEVAETLIDPRDAPMWRFMQGQAGPIPKTAIDAITGRSFTGEPLRDDSGNLNITKIAADNSLPFWWNGIQDQGLKVGISEFFGTRTLELRPSQLLNQARELILTTSTDPQVLMWKSQQIADNKPIKWKNLPILLKRRFSTENEILSELGKDVRSADLRGGDLLDRRFIEFNDLTQLSREILNSRYVDLQSKWDATVMTGKEFRDVLHEMNIRNAERNDTIFDNPSMLIVLERFEELREDPDNDKFLGDIAFDKYQLEILSSTQFEGEFGIDFNFDLFNQFNEQFQEGVGPRLWEYIQARKVDRKVFPPIVLEFNDAKEALQPYWNLHKTLPRKEDQQLLQDLRNVTGSFNKKLFRDAFPRVRRLEALMARKQALFRRRNPQLDWLLVKFYDSAPVTPFARQQREQLSTSRPSVLDRAF